MANGDTVHELLAGEPVNFNYIKNSGDADLTRMTYEVTVYQTCLVSGYKSHKMMQVTI